MQLPFQIVIVVDQWVGPDDKDSEKHILQVISFQFRRSMLMRLTFFILALFSLGI